MHGATTKILWDTQGINIVPEGFLGSATAIASATLGHSLDWGVGGT